MRFSVQFYHILRDLYADLLPLISSTPPTSLSTGMQPHLQGSVTLPPREYTTEQAHDANLEQLQQQAAMLSNLPVVNRLLSSKEAVSRLASHSPMMSRLLALNPLMKDMLQPEAVTQLLQAAQDPQALQHLLGMSCLLTTPQLKLMQPLCLTHTLCQYFWYGFAGYFSW